MLTTHLPSPKSVPVFVVLVVIAALVTGCDTPTPIPPTATATSLPEPTATQAPTATPEPTATVAPTAEPITVTAPITPANPADVLAGTSWTVRTFGPLRVQVRLVRGTEMTLLFGNDGQVSGSAGCNTFTSSYVVDGETLDIEVPAKTRKACGPLTMRQEYYYLEALGQAIRFALNEDQLRITYNRGRGAINLVRVEDAGTPDDADAPMGATEKVIYVGPQFMDCDGAGRTCLPIRDTLDGKYLPYNGEIEGFDYLEGYTYELKVQEQPVANPPTGGPSVTYTLVELVRRTPAEVAPTPEPTAEPTAEPTTAPADTPEPAGAGALEKTAWRLGSVETAGVQTPVITGTEITLLFGEGDTVGGSSGCNSFVGSYVVDGGAITFSQLVMTLKACADPAVMAQEQAFIQAIQGAETVALFEDQLVLTFEGGNGVLHFVRMR